MTFPNASLLANASNTKVRSHAWDWVLLTHCWRLRWPVKASQELGVPWQEAGGLAGQSRPWPADAINCNGSSIDVINIVQAASIAATAQGYWPPLVILHIRAARSQHPRLVGLQIPDLGQHPGPLPSQIWGAHSIPCRQAALGLESSMSDDGIPPAS